MGVVKAGGMLRLAGFAVIVAQLGAAQAGAPRFEVASVKPSTEQRPMSVQAMPGGRLVATAPVKLLVMNAYGMQRSQIDGGPGWMNNDHYEIDAKAEGNSSRAELMVMLQGLLEDRFQLKVHREKREIPVYVLAGARGGPRLTPPKGSECPAQPAIPCGQMRLVPSAPAVRMEGDRVPLAELVRLLAVALDRPVLDGTNVSGLFDIRLHFLNEPTGAPPSDAPEPTVFNAIQEQLGLKLESTKGPVEFLVIDRVERPTAN